MVVEIQLENYLANVELNVSSLAQGALVKNALAGHSERRDAKAVDQQDPQQVYLEDYAPD
ncbi:hypothetical protein [Rhizobium sp. NFACC06-2]|uniref:hypothetical protein n=1 Tax=Rhizobium sp. NFACC06-2 TaxID=1566264 RepID=UPI0008767D98|nr:hypothetical protein [Rhizobium sp. NFACC06-2]SCY84501.1 hypothetical protein SAMN03159288_04629 [Rhizobium sp. NFACC06-2]